MAALSAQVAEQMTAVCQAVGMGKIVPAQKPGDAGIGAAWLTVAKRSGWAAVLLTVAEGQVAAWQIAVGSKRLDPKTVRMTVVVERDGQVKVWLTAVWIITVGHRLFADQNSSIADQNQDARTRCPSKIEAAEVEARQRIALASVRTCARSRVRGVARLWELACADVDCSKWLASEHRVVVVLLLRQSSERGKYPCRHSIVGKRRMKRNTERSPGCDVTRQLSQARSTLNFCGARHAGSLKTESVE